MRERTSSQAAVHRPLVIGVTGSIACGKSSVMSILAQLGATTIDADRVYHTLIERGRPLWKALADRFGSSILYENGEIDRRRLADIVFDDASALADLDQITHPAVTAEIERQLARATTPVVAVDAVKLVESGMADRYDSVWVVTCTPEQQFERLMKRSGLTDAESRQRIQAQPPVAGKIAAADVIIDNSSTLHETEQQVNQAWSGLSQSEPRFGAAGKH